MRPIDRLSNRLNLDLNGVVIIQTSILRHFFHEPAKDIGRYKLGQKAPFRQQ